MLFSRDPNTIFRGNSLTSKCIDETMKLAGMHYLHVTLKPTIEEVGRVPGAVSLGADHISTRKTGRRGAVPGLPSTKSCHFNFRIFLTSSNQKNP